ncbi:Putative Ig domain family (plasmid) [Tistrella mobilis KA081020-065]|uniref:Ig domain family n=1 Tax=Tistrella mobilis (strain KA081020-065) TaxID=1110502 RepID=I3TXL7_TISMK|nr:Putative Ig domain family [Tistrella mobilis KA081020-065]
MGDTFTQKDIDDGLVTYDHDGSEGASGGFGFSVKDTTNLTLSSQSFAITITAVNDAPEITAPASIDVTEDTETALTGISISDADAGTGEVTVTFTVGEGELAATSTADVTVGGTATALTLTGSVADINAFIAASALTFTPAADATGNVTLTVDVDDGGNTGSGGAKTDTATVTLAVSAVNDAPTIDGSEVALTTTNENTPSTTYSVSDWLTDVNYADPDSGAVSGIAITGIVGNGAWQYTTDGTNWYGLGTTASDAAALLFAATTQFRFIPDNNRGGPASLTFRGWDQTSGTATSGATLRTGDASSTGGSTAYSVEDSRAGMVVTQINDAPTLSNTDVTLDPIDRNDVSTPVTVSDLLTDAGYGDVDASPSSGIAITALTGTGSWEYSTDGTNWYAVGTVSVNASLLLAADAQLRYDPAGNTAETATISFRAWDQTIGTATSGSIRGTADTTITGSSSAYSSALATGSMEVTVVNEAPVLTVPGSLTVNEDTDLQITGISIADTDDLGQDYVLTITAPGGSFTVTGTADVTVAAGGQTLILTGSRADINAFISGGNVTYRPGVNVTGTVDLSVSVSDQDAALPGTDAETITVTVDPVNDAPDVYTIDNGVDVVGMPEPISNPIWMLDAPGGGHYVVSSRTTGGDAYQNVLVYRYNADGSIDTSYGTDGAAYFTGTVPSAVKVLDSGELIIAGRAVFDSSLVVTRLATDGSVVSGFPITVIQASSSFGPVDIEIDGSDRIYVTATLTPTSGDTSTVVFRFTADGTADGVFNVGASIPGSEQALDSVIQPDGKVVTLAAQGRDLIVYRHNADRTLDTSFGTGGYLIIDTDLLGGGTGAQAVSVQADGSILVASATEDSGLPGQQVPVIWRLTADGALDTGFGVNGAVTGEAAHTVSFAFAPDGGIIVVGTISFAADISTTVQRFTADGVLDAGFGRDGGFTIGGTEFPLNHTSVRIDADTGEILLGGVHYDSALQPADIYFARYDATGQPVFDADPAAYTENGAAVVIAPTIAVDDVDLGDADTLDGFTVSLTRDGGADGQDQFSAADGGTLDALTEGDALVVSGTTIGTVVTNSAGTLVLSLNAAATRALVNEALRQIAYTNSSDAPAASVDLVWTVNDGNSGTQGTGGAAEGTLTTTVAITTVNDAPVITVPAGATITVTEDTATAITGISFADADAGSGTVEVTLSVDKGTITATSGAGVTVTDGTKAIMLSGTIADINAFIAAQGVTFQTDTDDTGDVTLTVDIDDLGNSGGASETASETVTITVDAVNDAPDVTTMPDGVVVVDGPGDMDSVGGIVALPDGSYYQFGVDTDVAPNMIVVARYDADGKLDTSFGTNGVVTLDGGGTFTPVTALLQSNGKLLISGTVSPSGGTTAAVLISLNDDGSMDEGFGTSGVVLFNDAGVEFSLFKVTVDDTGRILVAGMNFTGAAGTTDGLLYRLLADGSIDAAFNGGAPVAIDLGGNETLLSVAVQDDGKIVVAGANDDGAILQRYNADGTLDTGFGGSGTVTIDDPDIFESSMIVLPQSAGGMVVVNIHTDADTGLPVTTLVRLTDDGSVDGSFGSGGSLVFTGNLTTDATLLADGSMVFVGTHMTIDGGIPSATASIIKIGADGQLDTSFGTNGEVTFGDDLRSFTISSLTIDDNGDLLLGGSYLGCGCGGDEIFAARFTADGTPVIGFNMDPTHVEDGGFTAIDPEIDIYDPELWLVDNHDGMVITITRDGGADADDLFGAISGGTLGDLTEGEDLTVGGTVIGTVTTNAGGTLVLTLNADATYDLVNEAAKQIGYATANNTPPSSVDLLWSVDDGNTGAQGSGGALTGTHVTTMNIQATNDSPVVTDLSSSPVYMAGGAAVAVVGSAALSDVDSTMLTGVVLTLTTRPGGTSDYMGLFVPAANYANDHGISYNYNSAAGTLTLSGTASVADYQTVLQGAAFLYTGASSTMPGGDRVVSIVATDDSGDTDTQTSVAFERTIEVNAAPKVDTNTGTTVDEGGSTTITSAMLSSSDSEDTDPADVTYTLTTAPASGTLKLDGTALEVGDTFTQKDIDDGLVTYDHDGSETASGSFGFSVKDTTNLSVTGRTFAITISAVNDAPELTAPASIDVTEDTETALTGISISDADAGSSDVTVTFTVGEGTLAATSTADVTVGGTATALTLTGTVADINDFITGSGLTFTPDAEASGDVTLTIDVDDGGNTGSGGAKTDTATVTLSVSAVNDAPEITAPGSISVTEDVATALTGISISDADAGSNDVTVTLEVATGTLSATSGSGVVVGGTATSLTLTGTVTAINAFIAASGVGYTTAANATADVTLTVTVDDGGNTGSGGSQTDTATVTLEVTAVNDAPELTAPASIDVTEDTETALTGISISDVDASTGEVTVTFTVGEGELAATSTADVTVGGTATALTLTGTVTDINAFLSGGALTFTPVANANGDVTLTVDIDDGGNTGSGGARTDTATVTLSVSAVNDQPTAPVLDNDEVDENDAGAVIGRVTATDADGDTLTYTVDDARFEIVSVDGVQLLRLKEGVSLDYETEPTVDLVLTVTDPDNASNATNVTITIRDDGVITPLPVLTGGNVTENDTGAVVGTLPTLDGISYTVDDTRFEIVESDGRTVLKLKDGISLDREAAAEVTVTITATDADNETRTADVLIRVANVNEAPSQPVLTGGTVAENAAGVAVGTLASTDPDAGDTLTYTVDDSRFEVVGNVLKLKDGVSLDREAAATIDLVVTVTDGDGLTAERTVTVTVSNVNEAPSVPVFTGDGTVAENDAGAAIGTVTTSDPDVDDLAGLSVDDARFEIVDGQLKLKDGVSLDHESEPTITLVLTATDGGGLTATRLLMLTVTDVNEAPNAPVLDGNVVVENDIGAVIGNVSGGDPDDGDSVTYTVDDARFEIVGGQLKLKDGEYLDYEAATSVDLVITATDVAGLQTQSTVSVKVLDDTNSAATPVLSNTTVTENEAGAVIGTLPVATLNGYIVDDARFEVVFIGMTPTLKLKDGISLDHEAEPTVTLQITSIYVNDDAKTGTFVITVADANEQVGAPVLDNDSVAENAEGAVIGRVSATDPDDASTSFGQKTFTVDDARFEIVDGLLKLKDGVSLDHETEATVTLNIQVTDGGGLSDSLVATINVTDLNETPSTPVVSGATVAENAAGAVIGTVTSTDPDAGDDLTYTVNDDRFEIVDVAGDMVLKLKDGVSLDHEAAGSVALVITATDTGGLSAERVMLVTVTDVNEAPTTPVLSSDTVQGGDAGAIVGRVTATDPDDATTQEGRLTFNVDDSRFEIVGDMLKLKAGESLSVGDEPTVSLVITATDGLGLASTQTVVLTVLPDATPPVPALPDGIVSENTPGGVIGPVRFTDPVDPGVDVSLTVDDARFEIVDVDGVPTLKLKDGISLDREAEASVTLVITATTIEGSRSNVVVIAVDNVNETPTQPVLTGATVAENAAGAEIGTVTGSDPDAGDTLTFTVDDDRFEIVDGSLKLKDSISLDYETEASVDLVITATDADGLTATRSVTITVTDVNEAPAQPVLSGSTVAENAAGAVIGTVTGSDPDDGDSITFTVDDDRFEIVDGSLKLKDGIALDYETEPSVNLVITATDGDGLTATRAVTITVVDDGIVAPTPVLDGGIVAENAAGAIIGSLPDIGDGSYAVDDARFEIVERDGVQLLKLKDGISLDHEAAAEVVVRLTATGGDGGTAEGDVTIRVTDVNEAPAQPVLDAATVAENAAGATIGRVTATDPDDPTVSFGQKTFTVDDARFEIVGGVLKLKDGVSLDHEAAASIDLVLTVTDGGGLTASRTVTITVTDVNEAPAQPVLSGATVAENAAGAVIGTVTGSDPDAGDMLTFSVDDSRFEIVDGTLKLKDGIALDHEVEASVQLTITATDAAGLAASRSVTITVGDVNEAPTAPALDGNSVVENLPGAVIGVVSAGDPDAGDTLTYTVDDARFEIVGDVLKLKAGVSLDFETEPSVDLVITATDAGGLATSTTVQVTVVDDGVTAPLPVLSGGVVAENAAGALIGTLPGGAGVSYTVDDARFEIIDRDGVPTLKLKDGVSVDHEAEASITLRITSEVSEGDTATAEVLIRVTDVNEAPAAPTVGGSSLPENTAGAVVGRVSAVDPDDAATSAGQLTYTVDDTRFEIVSGVLKLKDGITLDHEAEPSVDLVLTVIDGGGLTTSRTVTITVTDVNEAPAQPVVSGTTVTENVAGAVVGTVSGTDPDAGDTLTFTVDDARFEIVSGVLKLKDGVSLDHETTAELTLVVTATDAGGLTASRLVTVAVADVNEAPAAPTLDGSVVPEGVAGAGIGMVTATDPDDDALTYTVDDARFEIVDGVLKLKDGISLDAETEASIDLVITATDPDGLSASATVTITVLDDGVTPTVPVLTGRTVAENLAGGVIGTLPDPNGGSFSVDDARFEIVDLDGTWTLKLKDGVSLDHEAEASVRLVITSTAVDDTTLSSTVTITVSDVNEVPGAPALDGGTVAENAAGAVVGRVTASDPDSGSTANGRLTYTVDDARFEIVGGVLKLKDGVSLDHEAAATVDLVLTVTDGGGLTASRTVTITVSDVNEAPATPSVSGTEVAENAPGAVIGAVTCTDPDGDALTYTVDDSRFEIVDIDGVQTLKLKDGIALDHESDPTVTLVVTARDPGGLATAMIVTLAVGDVNEAPTVPVVTGDAVQGGSEGAIVGRVSASDPDDPLTANGRLTYTVDDARFEIVGGVLKLKDGVVISAADEASVSLVITVTDGGGLSASTTVDLTVRPDTTPPVPVIADGRVPENAPGAVVGVIGFLEDVDPGVDVTVAVDDARFEVVTQDGSFVLKLKDGVALDHEAADRVTLLLTTTTIEGTRSSVVTIAIGDVNEAPSAPVLSGTVVPEDAQVIGRVTATDPDAAETLTFSVNDPRFEIVDGELRLVAGETLDHEGEPFVDLVITVTDKGGLTASTAVRLTVTDVPEAPTTPVLEGGDIPENEPGVAIGTVTADDPDGKGLTFTVDDDRFEVVGGVLKLKDGVSLDYETEGSVSVVITATAANGFSASETYVLQVLDGNDAPTAPVLDGSSVPENQAGAVIGTVTATDQDVDDELTFTVDDDRFEIVDGQLKLKDGVSLDYETEPTVTLVLTVTDREAVSVSTTVTIGVIDDGIVPPTPVLDGTTVPENAEGAVVGTLPDVAGASYTVDDARFEVVELDGTWTLKLKDGIALDHEAAAEITLRITASGADGGTVSALVLVRVLDVDEAPAAPVLDGDTVAENAAGGVIGRVTATDPDGADTGNGRLTYGVDDARFEIVGGVLKLKDGVALDHEAEPVVDLVITVTDGGGLTATRSVTITVTDVNEAPAAPVVSGSSVAENAAGAVIGSVTAGDPDGDALTFTVDDARFEIVDGQLKLKDGIALDHEAEPSVALVLTATDAGGLSATRVVVVTVTDVNEAPAQPVLSASLVGENQPGAVIGTISASDPDGDALTFSVDDARFEIVDGQLKLKDGVALDFETEPTVDLVITAQDAGGLTSSLTVTITVVDDGMQPVVPVLTGSTVAENAAGAVIGTLPDPEGGSFTVDDARFEIVEADGSFVLKLKDGIALDHEAAATIDLVITSTDIEGHSLDAPITIRVTNVNEASGGAGAGG